MTKEETLAKLREIRELVRAGDTDLAFLNFVRAATAHADEAIAVEACAMILAWAWDGREVSGDQRTLH